MLSSLFVSAALASSVLAYNPFPLPDGFPSPSASQLKKIELAAGGSLPNSPLPTKLTAAATATLQLIALNEIFEVAYFTDLVSNITHGVKGYVLEGAKRDYALKTFAQIKNQEELHALGANGILANAHQKTIAPCQYKFPVSDYLSAVTLANTFTDVVLSVLPTAQTLFGTDGGDEVGLIQLIGSIIAQEGEQDGYFRSVQGKVPSAAPFLTTSNAAFAFTFLQSVILPGCPGVDLVKKSVPTFAALNVLSKPAAKNEVVTFSVHGKINPKENTVAYLSGQNLPVIVPIENVKYSRGVSTFTASLPFVSDGFAQGLTVAAVMKSCHDKPTTAAQVAEMTVYGPGIIEVQ